MSIAPSPRAGDQAPPRRRASPPPRGDATREQLIKAALVVFARDGYSAASTRALAQSAGVNQALIGYHFGGKQGLYLAVFEHIAQRVRSRIEPVATEIAAALAQPDPPRSAAHRRRHWLPMLLRVADGMTELLLGDETEGWAQLIVREQQHPTEAFDRLYAQFMGPMLGLATQLLLRLRPDLEPAQARARTVAMFGQALVWRVARAGAQRHMGWKRLADAERRMVHETVRLTVTALVSA